jgi:thioredoxin-related protein
MQNTVYSHDTVQEYLDENFTYVRLNSDTTGGNHQYADRTFTTSQLASALGSRGVPTTVFMKPDGTPIARQPGFIKRPTFLTMIRFIGSGAYEDQSYKEYASQQSK